MILNCYLTCTVPELKSSVILIFVFLYALSYFNLAIVFKPFILK